jgi:uncharacterized protein (TIGR02246 family)
MNRSQVTVVVAVLVGAAAVGWTWAEDDAKPVAGREADDAAIRKVSAEFARAISAGDAKTVAAFWTESGEYRADEAAPIQGRAALEKAYAEFLAKRPKVFAEAKIDGIRFLGKDTALEEGKFTVKPTGPASPAVTRHYTTLYAREGGQWKFALVKEWAPDAAGAELTDLAWLVGTWGTKQGDREATSTYEWAGDKKFLKVHFAVKDVKAGKELTSGVQVIGVDPATRTIRSWLFGSDGAIGEANWSWDGEQWTVDSTGSLADGGSTTARNFLRRTTADAFTWHSVLRTDNGKRLPDIAPVNVTRVAASK